MFDACQMGKSIQESKLSFTGTTLELSTLAQVIVHRLDEVEADNRNAGDVEWFSVPVDGGSSGAIYLLVVDRPR